MCLNHSPEISAGKLVVLVLLMLIIDPTGGATVYIGLASVIAQRYAESESQGASNALYQVSQVLLRLMRASCGGTCNTCFCRGNISK